MSSSGEFSAPGDPFAGLLVESGLVTPSQLDAARARTADGQRAEETLIADGLIEPGRLRQVMSLAWGLPIADLDVEWIDPDLVRERAGEMYLEESWMPLRDQANGSILVATARIPDAERSAAIGERLASPVEFVVATAADIRSAVLIVFGEQSPGALTHRLSRALGRLVQHRD